MKESALMKKLFRIFSGGVLLGVAVFAAPSVFGQEDTPPGAIFTSVTDGKWVSFLDMTELGVGRGDDTVDIPAAYQGTRWNKSGETFNFHFFWEDEEQEYTRLFPGTAKNADGSRISAIETDSAIINGHTIDVDFSYLDNLGGHMHGGSVEVADLTITSNGTLNVNSGVLVTNGLVTIEQGSTCNVNGGDFYSWGDASSVINQGTFNINENSNIDMWGLINESTGRLNISNFEEKREYYGEEEDDYYLTAGFFLGDLENSGAVTLDNSSVAFGNYSGAGVLELKNGSRLTVEDGSDFNLEDNHQLMISGSDNVIDGAGINVTASDSKLNIAGSGAGTDAVTITGPVAFDGGLGTFNFENVNATLDGEAYDNLDKSEAFIVGNGTTLGGDGNTGVDFVFDSNSIHAPGNSPGTFLANTIAYNDGSTVYIDIGSTDVDKVLADGNIDFNGDVNVVLLNWGDHNDNVQADAVFESQNGTINIGGDVIANATVGAVVDNAVEIDGENAGKITVTSSQYNGQDTLNINGVLVDDVDSRTLGFDVTGNTLDQGGIAPQLPSGNTLTLGNVVLNMQGTGLYNAIGNYAGNDLAKLEAAVAQLDPVALSLGGRVTHDAVTRFNRANFARLQRFQDNRDYHARRFAANTYDDMLVRGQSCGDDYGCGQNSFGNPCGNRHVWFEMLGSFANQSEQSGIVGYSADTIGFGVGVDRRFSRNFVGGFGFGGSFTKADMDRGMGSTSVDNYMFSLYGSYFAGPWTIKTAGGYAASSLKSTRYASLIGGYANGDRDADTWFANLELSRRFGCANRYLTPFYAMDFIMYDEDAYTETGNLINMRVDASDVDAYLQTMGVRFGTRWQNERGWVFNPELTAGWIHDYGDGRISTSGQFVQGGLPFTVVGTSRNKDRALIGVGLNTAFSSRLSAFARYDGELASNFNTQTVQAGLNVTF